MFTEGVDQGKSRIMFSLFLQPEEWPPDGQLKRIQVQDPSAFASLLRTG